MRRLLEFAKSLLGPRQRNAGVYQRPDCYIFHSGSSGSGGATTCEPFLRLSLAATAEEVGEATMRVLAASRKMPWPKDWDAVGKPLLEVAGVKSHNKLMQNTKYCYISSRRGQIELMPTRPFPGDRVAGSFIPDRNVFVATGASLAEIGNAVIEGLARCE